MNPTLPTLELQFRRNQESLPAIEQQLDELFQFAKELGTFSPLLGRWFLTSDTSREDALRYVAFDNDGPTSAALAVLRTENEGVTDVRAISLWNGAESKRETAGLTSRCSILGRPDSISFRLKLSPEVTDWKTGVAWMSAALKIWPASFATFAPFWHSEHTVFKDRPGVGWMLYLPRVLTIQQIPEARALVPVLDSENKQQGTIIVSVTEEAFSDDNPEHVKIANAIEIRLVDQDLLPRYSDL